MDNSYCIKIHTCVAPSPSHAMDIVVPSIVYVDAVRCRIIAYTDHGMPYDMNQ